MVKPTHITVPQESKGMRSGNGGSWVLLELVTSQIERMFLDLGLICHTFGR
jgi:hypothetical protein